MIPYKLDYTIEKIRHDDFSKEQKILKELTGLALPKSEAKNVWNKVQDHKWYISERLRRDVGWRVAAVDYMENVYENRFSNISGNKIHTALHPLTLSV